MPDTALNRRQFTKSLAVGAAVSTIPAAGDEQRRDAVEADKPRDRAKDDATNVEADLALAIIKSRYPHPKLTPAVLQQIRNDIEGDRLRAKGLRTVPLANGDEPAIVFAAWRGDAVQ